MCAQLGFPARRHRSHHDFPRTAYKFSGGYQQSISQLNALDVTYVDSSLSTFNHVTGPFCFILSRQLKEFFGDTFDGYTDDDFKIFLSYVRFCMSHGFKQNDEATKYYGAMLREFWPQLIARTDLLKAYGVQLS